MLDQTLVQHWYFVMAFLASAVLFGLGFRAVRSSVIAPHPGPVLQAAGQVCGLKCFEKYLTLSAQGVSSTSLAIQKQQHLIKRKALFLFTKSALIKNWAQKHGVFVRKEELDTRSNAIIQQHPSVFSFQESLSQAGITLEAWKEFLTTSLLEQKLLTHLEHQNPFKPTPQRVERFYQKHLPQFTTSERVGVQHIFLQDQTQAYSLHAKLKQNPTQFKRLGALCTRQKHCRTETLWVTKGVLKVFDQAFGQKKHWISPVVEDAHGFHIVRRIGHKPTQGLSLAQARPSILRQLKHQHQSTALRNWLKLQTSQ